MRSMITAAVGVVALACGCQAADTSTDPDDAEERTAMDAHEQAYQDALARPWRVALRDDGTGDWERHWFLDGLKARVETSDAGMAFYAGPNEDEDASHAVLWTRQSFRTPIKVEYDYTRLDKSGRGVNIIYLLATGCGEPPFAKDITEWNQLREVPGMGKYFRNMELYHISYAAATYDRETQEPTGDDYVRGRRYMPAGNTLRGTNFEQEYRGTGLFRQGVPHHIVVIKSGDRLFMEVTNADQRRLFWFDTSGFPEVTEGRVGFRQMFTRNARYGNIMISQLEE